MFCLLFLSLVEAACTNTWPCHCCDTISMKFRIVAPDGSCWPSCTDYKTMTYSSSPDSTCDPSTGTKEEWKYDLGHAFCPVEGSYNLVVVARTRKDTTPTDGSDCGEYEDETATITGVYTVNYDADPNWCACKLGPGHWNLGGEVAATSCCGDDAGEYVRNCSGASAVCDASTDDVACCDKSTDCVYNGSCYASGSVITVNGGSYKCENGSWTNCATSWPGDWHLVSHCKVSSTVTVGGNIHIHSGGWLDLLTGANVHVSGGYIYVYRGGMITMVSGATLTK